MIRNLKALGLALVAVFAMSAVASSTASAEVTKPGLFTFNVGANELAGIDAEQVGASPIKLTINGIPFECGTATFAGHPVKTKGFPEEDVVEANTKGTSSTDVTLEPTFGPNNCHVIIAGLTKTVTITTNGCAFVFDAKTTEAKGGISNTALNTVECPTGRKIEVHVYSTAATEPTVTCTYDIEAIAANTTVPGIALENQIKTPATPNDILAIVKVNLTVRNTIRSAVCGQNDPETAVFEGEVTIRGTDEVKNLVDTSASS